MKDAIGQEIKVGDWVFHSGARSIKAGVYEVSGLTPKMVQVLKLGHRKLNRHRPSEKPKDTNVLWPPTRLVVVTDNLEALRVAKNVAETVARANNRDGYKTLGDWINR